MTSEKSEQSATGGERHIPSRIFVSEYVCGGGWPEKSLEPALAHEGRAMLLAVVSDLLRIPDCEVVTTWDRRLGEFPKAALSEGSSRLEVHEVDFPDDARFEELSRGCDAALVIAPEFHGILARRTAVAARQTAVLGSDVAAIELCSDKLSLAAFLIERGIPTIPTETLNLAQPKARWPFPIVIKRRDGAGSLQTFLIEDGRQLRRRCSEARDAQSPLSAVGRTDFEFVQQPFVSGEPLSAAVICRPGGTRDFLPACRQVLSGDGLFKYLGAEWNPALNLDWQAAADRLTGRILDEIAGLNGYVGLDLIGGQGGSVQIVEINPRLTTGYLAWQRRTSGNLAARILGHRSNMPKTNNTGQIRIHPDYSSVFQAR